MNAGEERGEMGRVECPSDGFKFIQGNRVSVTVGELGQAREDPVLEVVSHLFRVGF